MVWSKAIELIESQGAIAVSCKTFYVRNLVDWLAVNKSYVETLIERGIDPRTDKEAKRRKDNALEIVEALKDQANIYPAGTLPKNQFSAYPFK